MPRNHGRIASSIWQDPDFTALTVGPQRLYMFLLSQPNLSHLGVLPLTLRRWVKSASGFTANDLQDDLGTLERALFVVVDNDSEELLVRTLMRNDNVYKQPNTLLAAIASVPIIASNALKLVLLDEIARIDLGDVDADKRGHVVSGLERLRVALAVPFDCPSRVRLNGAEYPSPMGTEMGTGMGTGMGTEYPSEMGTEMGTEYPSGIGTNGTAVVSFVYPDVTAPDMLRGNGHVAPQNIGTEPDIMGNGMGSPMGTEIPSVRPHTYGTRAQPLPQLLTTTSKPNFKTLARRADFDAWWSIYPRKVGKDEARRAYTKATRTITADELLDATTRMSNDPNLPETRFIPHPATWLNAGRWDDEPYPAQQTASASRPSGTDQRVAGTLALAARLREKETQ